MELPIDCVTYALWINNFVIFRFGDNTDFIEKDSKGFVALAISPVPYEIRPPPPPNIGAGSGGGGGRATIWMGASPPNNILS